MPGNAPALEKGLRILEHVLAGNDPLTLSRIASDVGFKVSEIQRMVEYLANDGFLVKTASGAYTPGARAYGLADRKLDSAIIARAEGPMRRFAARCGASVHLGLLLQDKLHIVYEIEGTGDIRVGVRPGLYPALKTPSGRLLMAYLQRETGLFPEVKAELLREAYSFGELHCARGVYVVSVPIAVGSDRCAATLGASYLLRAQDVAPVRLDLVEELRRSSAEISALFQSSSQLSSFSRASGIVALPKPTLKKEEA